ncbi:alpha/beta-hydrolase [Xylaria sp. FL1042]|nr:alpha/beta-hydrolase [Xylaria sp. FL1042]
MPSFKTELVPGGALRDAVEDFHNIKFAHDTSGAQRFAPPDAYDRPPGSEIDATIPGPACPQTRAGISPFSPKPPGWSEDCCEPRGSTADSSEKSSRRCSHCRRRCVVKGSTYDENFDPAELVTRSVAFNKPVIHIVLNYRLTIFGSARLPILKDQKSLKIKDNIATFGGDPTRITSFGLIMPGPPGTALNMTSDATEIHTYAVAKKLGCNQGGGMTILNCLREIPMDKLAETVIAYSVGNRPPASLFTFIQFVKGVPMVFRWSSHALTSDDYKRLFSLYPAKSFEDFNNYEVRKVNNDSFEMAKQPRNLDGFLLCVYHYVLNQSMVTPLFRAAGMPYLGAVHGSDMDYLYNNLFPRDQMSESDTHVSDTLLYSFLNLAYISQPNSEGLPSWPQSFSAPGDLGEFPGESSHPQSFSLQVLGGPLGKGVAYLTRRLSKSNAGVHEVILQTPVSNQDQYGEMEYQICR